jgi:hypothetical protein
VLTGQTGILGGNGLVTGGGALTAGSGGGAVDLTNPSNAVSAVTGTAATTFALADSTALSAGPLSAVTVALSSAGNLTLTGDIAATALAVNAGGSILRTGGALAVGTLSGAAAGSADFGTGAAVGTLGAFAVPNGTLALADGQALTLLGPVTASSVDLAATGSFRLAGNITGLGTGTSTLQVLAAPGGGGTFVQTGQVTLADGPATAPVVRIVLPGAGSMSFAGLGASTVSLVLDAGSGSLAGTMAAGALQVQGAGGSALLQGSVAGDSSGKAAARAGITPAVNPAYTFNGCVIGAAFCTGINTLAAQNAVLGSLIVNHLLPSALPPPLVLTSLALQPLPSLTPPSRRLTDPDVVPPNISERDY